MSHAPVDDDEYGEDDDDLSLSLADWHYAGEPARYPPMKYNWETHLWECGCKTFQFKGVCKHAVRVRREELVEIDERFL